MQRERNQEDMSGNWGVITGLQFIVVSKVKVMVTSVILLGMEHKKKYHIF